MNPPLLTTDMLSPESTFRTSEKVTLTEMQNGEAVLLNLETWNYYSLNETGVHVWKRASEGEPVSDIVESLSERWDVSTEESRRAVTSLLSELMSENLLAVSEDSESGE